MAEAAPILRAPARAAEHKKHGHLRLEMIEPGSLRLSWDCGHHPTTPL